LFLPYLQSPGALSDQIENVTGRFGRGLLGALDTARASLYIAHSTVESFSTWRLWQVASTSAALVAEPGDAWPFVKDEHFIQIPYLTSENVQGVVEELKALADQHERLSAVATQAHELAQQYSVDAVEDDWVVPAIEGIIQ
jgi:hypothetical protein